MHWIDRPVGIPVKYDDAGIDTLPFEVGKNTDAGFLEGPKLL